MVILSLSRFDVTSVLCHNVSGCAWVACRASGCAILHVRPAKIIEKSQSVDTVQLIVDDDHIASAADTVTISTLNIRPVADAGLDQTGQVGQTITLDGSASSDVDGDSLTHWWALTTKPAGSPATVSDPVAS